MTDRTTPDRRTVLKYSVASTVAAGTLPAIATADDDKPFSIKNNRIKQSIMGWCFSPMKIDELAKHCKEIGLVAMEGIDAKHYPMIQDLGLKISLVGSHGFKNGPCNRDNREECVKALRDGIDLAKKVGCRNVITFTGMRQPGVSDKTADQNCIECWQQVMSHAEENGVRLCLEHLNSRDDSHPMKGHPGYYGDDVDHCVDLIRKVNSPNMKLLFDVYHVQVMNGDVIRRLRKYKDVIGHYHTAGNPGRGELDEDQEINYPAIMREIVKSGFDGYVAQEFIPTWDDPVKSLRHAAEVCDV